MHNAINEIRELFASVEKFAAFAGKIDVSRYPFEKIGSFTKDRDEARFTLLSINSLCIVFVAMQGKTSIIDEALILNYKNINNLKNF